MPKRTDINSILILGAGPIVIGQACEFDYSGTQACKALKEDGYRVILVNSNPATIMTDPSLADATYIEPVEWETIEKIIEKEKPDVILPTMGGQTGLNTALDLDRKGVLKRHKVEMIGATKEAIDKAEDRNLFSQAMKKIGLRTPKAALAHNPKEAKKIVKDIGFPCVLRPNFTMGGAGGGVAYNLEEFEEIYNEITQSYKFISEDEILERELPLRYAFYPNKYFKATPILLYINLLVFIYHLFLGASLFDNPVEFYIDNGGNNLFFSMIYKQWRLVTSIFIHSGVIHLLSNIFSLLLVGYLLEKIIKPYFFIISYLFFGIMANLSSIFWSDLSVSVGASGAIFGLFGLLISISIFQK